MLKDLITEILKARKFPFRRKQKRVCSRKFATKFNKHVEESVNCLFVAGNKERATFCSQRRGKLGS